jgi:hypothetical protein
LSDLGEISTELNAALARLTQVADRFADLDRRQLAPLEAELCRSPQGQRAAALIARARGLVRQAEGGARVARGAGADWLAQHGSGEAGGSGAGGGCGEETGMPTDDTGSAGFAAAPVRGAAAVGIGVPGGRAYFDPGETQQRTAAASLPPFDGEYTLVAHGASDHVFVADHELGAAEVAELIRSDPGWGGRPVRLLSCNTGRGEGSIAAQLAERLGVEVTAPDDIAWFSAEGWTAVAPVKVVTIGGEEVSLPDWDNQGRWRVFAPGREGSR